MKYRKLITIIVIFFSLQSCKKDIKETELYQYDKVELVFGNKTDTTIFYKVNQNEDYFILENGFKIPKKNLNSFKTFENKNWESKESKEKRELLILTLILIIAVAVLYYIRENFGGVY